MKNIALHTLDEAWQTVGRKPGCCVATPMSLSSSAPPGNVPSRRGTWWRSWTGWGCVCTLTRPGSCTCARALRDSTSSAFTCASANRGGGRASGGCCGGRRSGPWRRYAPKVRARTTRSHAHLPMSEVVARLNLVLRGWGNYFRYGNSRGSSVPSTPTCACAWRSWRAPNTAGRDATGPRATTTRGPSASACTGWWEPSAQGLCMPRGERCR